VADLTSELRDFSYTAAFIDNLDLVVSVDTAAAHLAGAMGKEVYLMLSYGLDWRWLKDVGYSPWYPSMRVFRSHKPESFENVVAEIHNLLQLRVGDNK
jgi:ADP-heptose:LPS heptosyltransferase